ncbi:BMC domain-containing protein [Desulfuromusa kysingii]|uniref:BMC domain-containing protein n=1 Tax=Desulfuromusa kysingii TaxID=37625 RepID=A0A1H3ZY68_9BACT|nr:BMC domain-containing protein [Desulfuromusa kysingii]SEA28588.1 BMC domain-containing protein [Desulfuromusa kysingii]
MNNKALGIFETIGFVPAVTGADAALKSADVELLGCRYVGSGLVSVLLSGDVSSVKVAVDSGCSAAAQVGSVESQTVIARTAEGLGFVVDDVKQKQSKSDSVKKPLKRQDVKPKRTGKRVSNKIVPELSLEELSRLNVVKLRELSRQIPGIALDRKIIRSARKDELIDAIISCYQKDKE